MYRSDVGQQGVSAVEGPGTGVRATFDGAYPRLFAVAYRVSYRLLGSRTDAEEVAQETLTRALVHWRRIADAPDGWVVRVASNLALDVVRAAARRHRVVLPERLYTVPGPAQVDDRLDLQAALLRLPRRQREVLVLRFLADLPESVVADTLGCTVGTVKQHSSRGLAALRVHFLPVPSRS